MGGLDSICVMVYFFASYEFVGVYNQLHLSFLWCLLWVSFVWCIMALRIFFLDINEGRILVELKKQGCRELECELNVFGILKFHE